MEEYMKMKLCERKENYKTKCDYLLTKRDFVEFYDRFCEGKLTREEYKKVEIYYFREAFGHDNFGCFVDFYKNNVIWVFDIYNYIGKISPITLEYESDEDWEAKCHL